MKQQEKPRIVIATIIYCTSNLSGQLCHLLPLSLTYYTILHYSLATIHYFTLFTTYSWPRCHSKVQPGARWVLMCDNHLAHF